MQFDPSVFGADVARILALDGSGQRLIPLTCGPCSSPSARNELQAIRPAELFPQTVEPDAAMAGLWLYFSCFEEAHKIADACSTQEGDLWHAIVHRQEPDSGNAAYWFRKAGSHPIFEGLAEAANHVTDRIREAEFRVARWDPYAFISFCERARRQPGSAQERAALEIQRAEWQLLFAHCARPVSARAASGKRMA